MSAFSDDIVVQRLQWLDVCLRRLGGAATGDSVASAWCAVLERLCCTGGVGCFVAGSGFRRIVGADGEVGQESAHACVGSGDVDGCSGGRSCVGGGSGDGDSELLGCGASGQGERGGLVDLQEVVATDGVCGVQGLRLDGDVDVGGKSDGDGTAGAVRPEGAGAHWERNRLWRKKKSEKKQRRREARSGVGPEGTPEWRRGARANVETRSALRESLEKKWQAENALRAFEADRKLELLKSQDVDDVKRMQRAQVLRTTETCKVQVERAFRSLRKTGDVPADGTGSAETVVSGDGTPSLSRSDGSGISPDSSVSMQEIRQMQKDLLDAAEREKKYEEALGFLEHAVPEQYKQAMYRANCKKAYTLDSQGEPEIDTVGSIRDGKFYPEYLHEGYALNPRHRSARNEVPFPGEEDLW